MVPLSGGPEAPYKAVSNYRVLSALLNELYVDARRTSTGRLFQAVGPATLKALSPNFNLLHLMSNELYVADHEEAY